MTTYYAILISGPHDVSVRLSATQLQDAIDEVARLNAKAMIGTNRRDADYYLGVSLGDTPVEQREAAMVKAGAFPVGDVIGMDDERWSLFATA